MKLLFVLGLSMAFCAPAFARKPQARKVASVNELGGSTAKAVFEGLPGEADKTAGGELAKEGDLICYHKGNAYHCSVRGEDEETGTLDGLAARQLFEMLPAEGEYEDESLGKARESMINCFAKGPKHRCRLN